VSFLSKNFPCALNISWRKNIHMSDITWLTLFFLHILIKKYMHIPSDNYDVDKKIEFDY
jgi:hypothetical protein